WNCDNSRMLLLANSYFRMYDWPANSVKDLVILDASSEPRWSRTDPNVLFFHTGNTLKMLHVASETVTVVREFKEYSTITGKGKTDISEDGSRFIFIGDGKDLFVYDMQTDFVTPIAKNTAPGWNNVFLSPDNQPIISWLTPGTGRGQGVELFDADGKFIRQLARADGHMKLTRDASGQTVMIWTNSADPQPDPNAQNAIVMVDLKTGEHFPILQLDWHLAVHVSAADRGVAFVETYDTANFRFDESNWKPYVNELMMIDLATGVVTRLAHHRSRATDTYNYMPKLTCSRDGSLLAFGSNFGMSLQAGTKAQHPIGYTDAYYLKTPAAQAAPSVDHGRAATIETLKGKLREALAIAETL
ncbi:MAG TPA: hypothetical protein VNT29_00025, partial [Candidatus Limnocylindrales bacterium]|nr:hypothetical protein [Candidatus Limnocylindrales bacterium]